MGEGSITSLDEVRRKRHVEALSREHGDYLRALARKLCRGQLDPDDLVQDVYEKLMKTAMPDGANERAWASRVMHNQFIDKLRRRAARREEEVTHEPVAPTAEKRVWWERLTEVEVRDTLALLPAEQRATFELFAFAGKSYDEIAKELGIAKATVGTRILRARLRIRELLTERKPEDSGG